LKPSRPLLASILALSLAPLACTSHGDKTVEPVHKEKDKAGAAAPAGGEAAAPEAGAPPQPAPTPAPVVPETCFVPAKMPAELPAVAEGRNVVVTRIQKVCTTRDGRPGIEKDTAYLAMGFPCTAGQGRIELKGNNYNSPKIITFIIGTDCPMEPASSAVAKSVVTDAFGFPPEAKLAAYTPFVVQFWEIPGMSDLADTGFTIELRAPQDIEAVWGKVRTKEPMRLRLFGRENSWGQGDNLYLVEADMKLVGRTTFQLSVVKARALTKDEIDQVRTRCEALRPKRNCGAVF
jgi:hypothetical protein